MMARKGRSLGLAALLGMFLAPGAALSEQSSGLTVGQTIRITPPKRFEIPGVFLEEKEGKLPTVEVDQQTLHIPRPATKLVGKLVAADARTITILREGAPISIPREAVGVVEVRRGKGHLDVVLFALGAGAGFIIGHSGWPDWRFAAICAIPGAVVGGWAGGALDGGRWQVIPSEKLGVSVSPRRDGAAVRVSLSF